MAVSYERAIWEDASLEEVNSALRGKAECYKQLGRYAEASATLGRVRMFALSPEERQEVLYQQELCYFLGGEFAQASTCVDDLEPSSRDILLLHALVLAYAGKFDESEIYAARFLSWDGESPHLQALLDLYAGHPAPRDAVTAMVPGIIQGDLLCHVLCHTTADTTKLSAFFGSAIQSGLPISTLISARNKRSHSYILNHAL